jgi:hypothetical protein
VTVVAFAPKIAPALLLTPPALAMKPWSATRNRCP